MKVFTVWFTENHEHLLITVCATAELAAAYIDKLKNNEIEHHYYLTNSELYVEEYEFITE